MYLGHWQTSTAGTASQQTLFPSSRAPVNIPLPSAEIIFWLPTSPTGATMGVVVSVEKSEWVASGVGEDRERGEEEKEGTREE